MKEIAVTGVYGFIGQHLCKKLTEYGHTVYEVGKGGTPHKRVDLIIHLGATTTLSKYFNPDLFKNNIVYADWLFSTNRNTKIIYASSTSAAELTNPYAYTKRYLEYLGEKHGNALGLRFFNVYGNGNNKGIIKRAIDCANSGETLMLSGGSQIRDFIYIDDVVNWICDNLDHEPGIVDIGRGEGMLINQAIKTVSKIMNKHIDIKYLPQSDTDMQISVAEPGIAGISLEEGLKKMLCEY